MAETYADKIEQEFLEIKCEEDWSPDFQDGYRAAMYDAARIARTAADRLESELVLSYEKILFQCGTNMSFVHPPATIDVSESKIAALAAEKLVALGMWQQHANGRQMFHRTAPTETRGNT